MVHLALISDHVGINPIIILERHAQHSPLTMWEPIPQPCQKGPTLTFDRCEEPIQHACSKRLSICSWHMRGTNPTYMFKKAQHLYFTHASVEIQACSRLISLTAINNWSCKLSTMETEYGAVTQNYINWVYNSQPCNNIGCWIYRIHEKIKCMRKNPNLA